MCIYKPAYIVTCNSGNEFVVKQLDGFGSVTIDAWQLNYYSSGAERKDYADLRCLLVALVVNGVSNEILLPLFIAVLKMVGFDIYTIDIKVEQ